MIRLSLAFTLSIILSGCGQSQSDVGGVSASEAKALNDAAAKLDAEMPPPEPVENIAEENVTNASQ